MLSYRHVFHAGNLGDVLKHLALLATLRAATRKETPLAYLESHAGAGSYALADDGPAEYRTGIAPLWRARRDISSDILRFSRYALACAPSADVQRLDSNHAAASSIRSNSVPRSR